MTLFITTCSRPHSAECLCVTVSVPLSDAATGCSSCSCCRWTMWWQEMWVSAWQRLSLTSIWFSRRTISTVLLIWMCKTRQYYKKIRYDFKALKVTCCLLTFILCYYHNLSLGDNDNALGFKALRRVQHLRVLTFLVLIGQVCVFRVTTEIGTTTLETKTSLTGKSLKRLLPGMHIKPGNWFCPPSF